MLVLMGSVCYICEESVFLLLRFNASCVYNQFVMKSHFSLFSQIDTFGGGGFSLANT